MSSQSSYLDRLVHVLVLAVLPLLSLLVWPPAAAAAPDVPPSAELRFRVEIPLIAETREAGALIVEVAAFERDQSSPAFKLRSAFEAADSAPGDTLDDAVDPWDDDLPGKQPPAGGSGEALVALQDRVRDAAASLPGVRAAAHAMFIPFAPGTWGDGYRRMGTDDPAPRGPMAHFFMVSPEYFEVMRIPLRRGRGLLPSDRAGAPPALVVSETFARQAFPGQDAVGRRLEWNDGTWEIVGVSGDVHHGALSDPLHPDVYVPRRQVVRGNTWLLLASGRPAASILAELQDRVKGIDRDIALTDAKTMAARLAESAAPARFRALVAGTLAALTLLLAIVGLHGVVSYAVSQRTREFGVRLALGQRPGAMLRDVMADTLRIVATGTVPGVIGAIQADQWLSSVAMVDANRPATVAGVVIIFTIAALGAAAGPAWRASRVDPMVSLRYE